MQALLLVGLLTFVGAHAVSQDAPMADARQELSLDGDWRIVFDEGNVGKAQGWHRADGFPREAARAIRVPSCWEETRQDYEGVAWYARTFAVPASWRGRHVRLRFGAVNFRAEVWLNGEPAGSHEGGYTPFELDVADLLDPDGANLLVVRAVGPAVTVERVDDLVRDEAPHWRGAIAGGIWQSVALVATGEVTLREVFVEPRLADSRAIVHLKLDNTSRRRRRASVKVAIRGDDEELASATVEQPLPPGRHELHVPLAAGNAVPWSPDRPQLYVADVQVSADGEPQDRVRARFGFRELTIRDRAFWLNGERVFLKCAFWEGVYPSTLAYPADAEMVRREIRLAKEAGFNALRPWRKPPPPPILDLCDEMGILVIDCPPIECMGYGPAVTPRLEERLANEIAGMVRRDRNHPSVVCWELFNEIKRPALARLKHKMALLARSLDPTRLIVDESGGWAGGAHAYLPYRAEPTPISEVHSYLRAPVDDWIYDFYASLGSPGAKPRRGGRSPIKPDTLLFVSEVGYGSLPDLPANCRRYARDGNPITPDYRYHHAMLASLDRCLDQLDLRGAFPDAAAFCLATQQLQAVGNRLQLEALRTNPRVAGYCLHAFTGGDWVMGAGILDLWREPKRAYAAVAEANAPLILAVRARPRNAFAGQEAELTVTAASDLPHAGGSLVVRVASEAGQDIWAHEDRVNIGAGVTRLVAKRATLPTAPGRYVVTAQLRDGDAVRAEGRLPILVVGDEALRPTAREIAAIDPQGRLGRFCKARGIRCEAPATDGKAALPIFVAADAFPPALRKQVRQALQAVERGGVAVFLEPTARGADGLLPFTVRARRALGNWVPVAHAVRRHPLFDGLPASCLMGQDYQNVCAAETLLGVEGETVVASISWEWQTEPKCYRGPGPFWWGSDLAVVPHGKGKLVLSTLRLLEHAGKDPVADKLLVNLVAFASRLCQDL